MRLAYRGGVLVGRTLRIGVRTEWDSFRRGIQAAIVGVVVIACGAAVLTVRVWNSKMVGAAVYAADVHRIAGHLDEQGQCYVSGTVNSTVPFDFLVDSGASNLSFSRNQISKVGVNPAGLSYNHRIITANGIGRAASVVVNEVRLGDFVLRDVPADVDNIGSDSPLLGMSILKFMQLEIGRGSCGLRW
jgi:clan AA aspartic protease (TIGR02281 family)